MQYRTILRTSCLHSVISNRGVNLSARRLLLLSVVRPTLEYGSEVWEGNKSQTAALESVMLGGAKRILGCSSKTCNEAVRGDMSLETLQGRRDKSKLKVWYKLASMSEDRYPRKLGEAARHDGVQAEHFKYGGPILRVV